MTSDYDKQRDIDAEGQRAAIFHGKGAAKPPSRRGVQRLLGISSEGRPVDNVGAHNRYDLDPKKPSLQVHLVNEDQTQLLHTVYIPNTRERPDVVVYRGQVYDVMTTNVPIPIYRQVMQLEAYDTPYQPGE